MRNYKLELLTFLLYFILCQIVLPLSIPDNPNIGPLGSWRLFSLRYHDYTKKILDFPCSDKTDTFLLRDKVIGFNALEGIGKEPSQLLKSPIVIEAMSDCNVRDWIIVKGLPYEYFILKEKLPRIEKGTLEKY